MTNKGTGARAGRGRFVTGSDIQRLPGPPDRVQHQGRTPPTLMSRMNCGPGGEQ